MAKIKRCLRCGEMFEFHCGCTTLCNSCKKARRAMHPKERKEDRKSWKVSRVSLKE